MVGEISCCLPWGVFATMARVYASEVCLLELCGHIAVYVKEHVRLANLVKPKSTRMKLFTIMQCRRYTRLSIDCEHLSCLHHKILRDLCYLVSNEGFPSSTIWVPAFCGYDASIIVTLVLFLALNKYLQNQEYIYVNFPKYFGNLTQILSLSHECVVPS